MTETPETAYQPRDPGSSVPLVICLRCGAVVDYNGADLHDEFHDRLDRTLP